MQAVVTVESLQDPSSWLRNITRKKPLKGGEIHEKMDQSKNGLSIYHEV